MNGIENLKKFVNVKSINLNRNNIGPKGAILLSHIKMSNLKVLYLSK